MEGQYQIMLCFIQEETAPQPVTIPNPAGMRKSTQWYVAAYTKLHRSTNK